MIKIDKSTTIPDVLTNEGIPDKNRMCNEYDTAPLNYTSRPRFSNKKLKKLKIDNTIYGDATVKDKLFNDQSGKCCYCEAKFTASSYGDVEHFRPKKAYNKGRKLIYPGYYWLAYEWNNLFFSCEKCNRSFKRNKFPLLEETTRVKNHNEANNLPNEKHTLINPAIEDPEDFIKFNQHIPVGIDPENRGKQSIKICGLDRPELNIDRLEYLNAMKVCEPFFNVDENDEERINAAMILFKKTKDEVVELIQIAKNIFKNAAKKEYRFTAMIRSNFPNLDKN